MARLCLFYDGSIAAVIEPAPDGGDGKSAVDPTANANRPAVDPTNWLSYVKWHANFFQFELISYDAAVEINHALLAGASTTVRTFGNGYSLMRSGATSETNHTLVTHNLGFVPEYMVATDGVLLSSGTEVQPLDNGGRLVSAYATDTIIGIRELAQSSSEDLPAIDIEYDVAVFRNPTASSGEPLLGYNLNSGRLTLGAGKLDTDQRYLRRVQPFESGFDVNLGPTMQFGNGGVKVVSGGNTYQSGSYWSDEFLGPDYIPIGGFT